MVRPTLHSVLQALLNESIFPRQSVDEKKASSCHNVGYRHIFGALVAHTLLSA